MMFLTAPVFQSNSRKLPFVLSNQSPLAPTQTELPARIVTLATPLIATVLRTAPVAGSRRESLLVVCCGLIRATQSASVSAAMPFGRPATCSLCDDAIARALLVARLGDDGRGSGCGDHDREHDDRHSVSAAGRRRGPAGPLGVLNHRG